MFRFFTEWFHRRQRRIDLKILWPYLQAITHDIEGAKRCFRLHAFNDSAWNGISWPEIEKMLDAETLSGSQKD